MSSTRSALESLIEAFNRREWQVVANLSPTLLAAYPHNADIRFMAGIAALESHQLGSAIEHLRRAVALAPRRPECSANLARALVVAGESRLAKEAADDAWACHPTDPATLDVLSSVFGDCGAHQLAHEAIRSAAVEMPSSVHLRHKLATTLVNIGEPDQAEQVLEQILRDAPRHWTSHLALSHIRRQTPEANHIDQLETLLAAHLGHAPAELHLRLALSKEYEDLGDFQTSLEQLRAGKKIASSNRHYSRSADSALFEAIKRFDSAFAAGSGHPSDEPIFVFGMPRTGTTLVDRILSSHPDVASAGELREFGIAARKFTGVSLWASSAAPSLASDKPIDWFGLGENYLSSTRHITGRRPHFVDKFTHNFLYAGFIARAFPNAKMICLRRHPVDTCLSNFRQLFMKKLPIYDYSFDLADTAHYYMLFSGLVEYWKQQYPGRILEVSYEALVGDPPSTVSRLLDFCGLSEDERCLHFHRNPTPVSTASSLQVRQNIYTSSVNRWKKYGALISDLLASLDNAGVVVER